MSQRDVEMREMEQRIRDIERHVGNIPVEFTRGGGGGSAAGFDIPTVTVFPPIPTTGSQIVARAGGLWGATAGDTVWNPLELLTSLSGYPGT